MRTESLSPHHLFYLPLIIHFSQCNNIMSHYLTLTLLFLSKIQKCKAVTPKLCRPRQAAA